MGTPRYGRSGAAQRRPCAAYYRHGLATYARHHCKPGTVAGYEAAGRLYLIPAFGTRDVRTITREDVKRLVYEALLPGRARATVRANLARRLFRATGIPYAWPHSLRHTYASLLIQHAESLAYVKAQLGHRSIQTTVDVYGHLAAGVNRAAVDRSDEA